MRSIFLNHLSIKSAKDENYDSYSRQIRQEYSHVPEEAFRLGRAKILTSFLQEGNPLYRTQQFQEKYIQKRVTNCK